MCGCNKCTFKNERNVLHVIIALKMKEIVLKKKPEANRNHTETTVYGQPQNQKYKPEGNVITLENYRPKS